MVSHRHDIAHNWYMQNFDPSQPDSYLMYLDSNNLYGWAMSQPMPTGNFQWVSQVLSYICHVGRWFLECFLCGKFDSAPLAVPTG